MDYFKDINGFEFKKMIEESFGDKNIPLYGTIELTNACNLKCVHCYGNDQRGKNSFSIDSIKVLIDQIVEQGGLCIAFTGGEVLTYPKFEEIYIYAKSKGLLVSIFSNATLLTEKHIELFKEYPITVFSTTAYGSTESVYENITKVEGSFNKFKKGIELLKENNIPFEIKAIVLKQNLHDIFAIKEWAKKLDVPFLYSIGVRPMDTGNISNLSSRISAEEAFGLDINDIERREFWYNKAINKIQDESKELKRKQKCMYLCDFGLQSYFITADGNYYICQKERCHPYNVIEHGFKKAWEEFSPILKSKKASSNFKCLKCKYFNYCQPCSAENELTNGSAEKPIEYYCELAKLRYNFCKNIEKNNKKL